MIHKRCTTLIPTAEPDNNAFGYYPTGDKSIGGYGGFDEAGYAMDGMLRFMSNVYEGFQLAVVYVKVVWKKILKRGNADCNGGTIADYDDVIDVASVYNALKVLMLV